MASSMARIPLLHSTRLFSSLSPSSLLRSTRTLPSLPQPSTPTTPSLLSPPLSSPSSFFSTTSSPLSTTKNPQTTTEKRNPHTQESLEIARQHRATKLGQPTPTTHPHLFFSPGEGEKVEVTPGLTKGEYRARRERLLKVLPPKSVVVLSGNTQKMMSNDIPYVFHQHSDLLYMSGFVEPGAILVLVKGETDSETTSIMFSQPREKGRETWDGIITGPERVVEGFGINEAFPHLKFERTLKKIIEDSDHVFADTPAKMAGTERQFYKALEREMWEESGKRAEKDFGGDGERKDWEVKGGETLTTPFSYKHPYSSFKEEVSQFILSLHSPPSHSALSTSSPSPSSPTTPPFSLYPISPLLQIQRLFKSPSEISLIKNACSLTSTAFRFAMANSRPEMTEHQLMCDIQYISQLSGATRLSYPPVVAGGENSLILHYVSCDEKLKESDMVLVDAGVELDHYCSDITRTWPVVVGGKEGEGEGFTERQGDVYDVVREVVAGCVRVCRSGVSMMELHSVGVAGLAAGLKKLGIVEGDVQEILLNRTFFKYYPHSTSHYLGLDVHDTPLASKTKKMSAGMVLTIEPGLYIPLDDPSPYAGIGIRLEENVLVTNTGCEVLSSSIPLDREEVEAACRKDL